MTSEVLDKIVQLLTAAFGLVAALAWNEDVQGLFRALFPEAGHLLAKFVYAVRVTTVVMIVLTHKQIMRLRTPRSLRSHRLTPQSLSA